MVTQIKRPKYFSNVNELPIALGTRLKWCLKGPLIELETPSRVTQRGEEMDRLEKGFRGASPNISWREKCFGVYFCRTLFHLCVVLRMLPVCSRGAWGSEDLCCCGCRCCLWELAQRRAFVRFVEVSFGCNCKIQPVGLQVFSDSAKVDTVEKCSADGTEFPVAFPKVRPDCALTVA